MKWKNLFKCYRHDETRISTKSSDPGITWWLKLAKDKKLYRVGNYHSKSPYGISPTNNWHLTSENVDESLSNLVILFYSENRW
jgi:hypothetical protein